MTRSRHLSATGNQHYLAQHLGSPDPTIIAGERYVMVRPTRSMAGSHYPDLLAAFDVDPAAYAAGNGCIIEEQGKPPDFVLEIASPHTGHVDVGDKRAAYAAWASWNTGGSMRRGDTTGPGWPATGWWRRSTNLSTLTS